jgi:hypothetical protein
MGQLLEKMVQVRGRKEASHRAKEDIFVRFDEYRLRKQDVNIQFKDFARNAAVRSCAVQQFPGPPA